jgi:hypothetical protein
LSGARAQRIETLANEQDDNRDKTRAVRARQRAIGRELRRIYDGVVSEPVPDDFLDLLKRIDESDDTGGKAGGRAS